MHASTHNPAPLAITGLGLVSPLGFSAWQTFSALLEGRTIAQRAAALEGRVDPVALVRAAGAVANVQHAGCDPSIALAEAAGRQALDMAQADPADTACFLGVSKGAMHALLGQCRMAIAECRTEEAGIAASSHSTSDIRQSAFFPVEHLAHELRRRLGLREVRTIVAACASSLTALHLARLALLDEHNPRRPRRALVLTSEAAILPMLVYSYLRLGVLPPLTPGKYVGRPLDKQRCGFMLCEAGAAVVVEEVARGQWPLLLDTAVAADGYDLVQAAPDMPALHHVAERLLAGRRIDVLHPHATGTPENDELEMRVYAQARAGLCPRPDTRDPTPAVYACKGALGHGLGAAGLVSLVIACLCAKTGRIPLMPWLNDPLDCGFGLKPQASSREPASSTHAVFAAGFGGHAAGAVMTHRSAG